MRAGRTRREGYDALNAMQNELSRLFDDFSRMANAGGRIAPLDMVETDRALEIDLELPGYTDDEIALTLEGDVLEISAETNVEQAEEGRQWRVRERRHGLMRRTIALPFAPEPDQVRADLDHGVLKIRIEKTGPVKPKGAKIKINRGGAADAGDDA